MRWRRLARSLLVGVGLGIASLVQAQAPVRPNIIFLLADDLGYTDIAPYGSEVHTPALSALAEQGIRFANYHTAANCAPARAMLLTGVSSHLAGVPNIPEMIAPEQRLQDNYQGELGTNVVTIATLLEDAGYHTYMAGKWHLGAEPAQRPSRRGFERTVALMDSGADNWEQRPYLPIYDEANWFADGERFDLPADFYSSQFLVDSMIRFIDSNLADGKPFFGYVPFQAVHLPVQAPQAYVDRYMGVYDAGWDALRSARLNGAVAVGLLPETVPMARMSSTRDWQALSDTRRRYESKRMAVYAGMIEAMDHHIGRLVAHLAQRGVLDNTIFVFTSDNGAEGSGPDDPLVGSSQQLAASMGYSTSYETLGQRGSYSSISPSFTSAAVSPLAYYKFYTGEGGLRVPLILSGAPLGDTPRQSNAFAWATDVAATILSFAGVTPPGPRYAGRPVLPITGRDLSPIVRGEALRVYDDSDALGYELTGQGALFQGDYKLVRNLPPLGDGQWRLFDIVSDPGETQDLAAAEPERLARMRAAYQAFERDNRVQPIPPDYDRSRQLLLNMAQDRLGPFVVIGLLLILILLPFAVYLRQRRAS